MSKENESYEKQLLNLVDKPVQDLQDKLISENKTPLTPNEYQVATYRAQGFTRTEVMQIMGLNDSQIRFCDKRIKEKTGYSVSGLSRHFYLKIQEILKWD